MNLLKLPQLPVSLSVPIVMKMSRPLNTRSTEVKSTAHQNATNNITTGLNNNNQNATNDINTDFNNNNGKKNIPHQQPTEEVQCIMQKYVADMTVACYKNELFKLMLWLINKDPQKYFHDWVVGNAIKVDKKDKKSPKYTKQQKHLSQVLKDILDNV